MSPYNSEDAEHSNLDNFLSNDRVQWFLDRHGIEPDEVQWFAQMHIDELLHEKYDEEVIGLVSLMYVHGTEVKSRDEMKPWSVSEHEAVLIQLGYENAEGPEGWEELHRFPQEYGPFSEETVDYVHRVRALADEVEPEVLMAYADGLTRVGPNTVYPTEKWGQICDYHGARLGEVRDFAVKFEETWS